MWACEECDTLWTSEGAAKVCAEQDQLEDRRTREWFRQNPNIQRSNN